ncbi:MAG: hypothetical protein ACFFAT_05570 [Promethearchaeota archaeon]
MKSKKTGIILVVFILFVSIGLFSILNQLVIIDTNLDINEEKFDNFNQKLKNSNLIPKEPEIKILGENITFSVNFTSGSPPEPVIDASVFYYIQWQAFNISTELLNFSEVSPGIYNKTIDTSKPIDSGGATLNSSVYDMVVIAKKNGLPEEICLIQFRLFPKNTNLTVNSTLISAYWNDNFSLEVHYQGLLGPIDLDGATVNYYITAVPGLIGSLTPQANGMYRLTLNTTLFPEANGREYIIQIVASIQNYETRQLFTNIRIYDIPTKINGTMSYQIFLAESEIFFREEKILYFNYSVASTGEGITSASVNKFAEIESEETGSSFFKELIHVDNGIWSLDIDSETLEVGRYNILVRIKERFYEDCMAVIILTIKTRESITEIYLNQQNKTSDSTPYIHVVGDNLNLTIKYKDSITGFHIPSAIVNITCGSGFSSNMEENGTQYTLIFDPLASGFQWGINTIIITVESSDHENISIIIYINMMPSIPDLNIPQSTIPGPDLYIIMLFVFLGVVSLVFYYKTKMKNSSM